jgi:SAM-dependent methyltransferase
MEAWGKSGWSGIWFGGSRKRMLSGWAPTPLPLVTDALRLANVNADDIVFDLGCGDGRVLVRAARMFGAKAIGFDIHPRRIREARRRARNSGAGNLVRIRRQDMLSIPDLHRATVVFLYLPQRAVNRLKPVLRKRCRKGTRIISVSSWVYRWKTKKELIVRINGVKWYVGLWVVE